MNRINKYMNRFNDYFLGWQVSDKELMGAFRDHKINEFNPAGAKKSIDRLYNGIWVRYLMSFGDKKREYLSILERLARQSFKICSQLNNLEEKA